MNSFSPIFVALCGIACTSTEDLDQQQSGLDSTTVIDASDTDADTDQVLETGELVGTYIPPCIATGGTWASCSIDRSLATGYQCPSELVLAIDPHDVSNEPWMNASVGNLGGHALDGIAFLDFSEQVAGAPGYLCVVNGVYTACPESLHLPQVSGLVTTIAIEDFDGDGWTDMVIGAADLRGRSLMEMATLMASSIGEGSVPPTLDYQVHFYSQSRGADGTDDLHWVDRTVELGFQVAHVSCAIMNVQAMDLTDDGLPEIAFGGMMCAPLVYGLVSGKYEVLYNTIPTSTDYVSSQTGFFVGPQNADGDRMLYTITFDGSEFGGDGGGSGSVCWFGRNGNWQTVRCPELGISPMGMTLFDPDQDGFLDVASSDIAGGNLCLYNDTVAGMTCYAVTRTTLPESRFTRLGDPYESVGWAVGAWDNSLVYVNGYEHALEDRIQPPVLWTQWSQQLQLYRTNDLGVSYERVHLGAVDDDVHERGLVMADFNFDGCLDLFPLPVGFTHPRLLANGTCLPGAQTVTFRHGRAPAYGAYVVMTRPNPSGGEDLHQASMVTSSHGYTGFGPPALSVSADVTQIDVQWTTGITTVHVRRNGRFPDVLTPASP